MRLVLLAKMPTVPCKHHCDDFPKIRPGYFPGHKYCSKCQKFKKTDNLYCECCGNQLRVKARDHNAKTKYQERGRRK